MKKSKDKQLWQYYWYIMGDHNTEYTSNEICIEPRRTKKWKQISNDRNIVVYGYRAMKIDNGQIVEA